MIPTAEVMQKARRIKMIIFDVDGVFTNGQIWLSGEGTEYKVFHCHDGYALKKLHREHDVIMAVISGRDSLSVALRMTELGITHVHQGIHDKLPVFEDLLRTVNLSAEDCAYVGDDEPDITVMEKVGLKIAVANGMPCVKKIADWETTREGGQGAVREVCDLIIQAKR